MESTILQAVASVFVEGSETSWVIPLVTAVIAASAGYFGARLGAKATEKAAKESAEAVADAAEIGKNAVIDAAMRGAEIEHEKAVQREKDRLQLIGKASLYILYTQFKEYLENFQVHNVNGSLGLVNPATKINQEHILKVVFLDAEIGFTMIKCDQLTRIYKETTDNLRNSPEMYSEKEGRKMISEQYDRFKDEFQKIENYYNEHVKPELNISH